MMSSAAVVNDMSASGSSLGSGSGAGLGAGSLCSSSIVCPWVSSCLSELSSTAALKVPWLCCLDPAPRRPPVVIGVGFSKGLVGCSSGVPSSSRRRRPP